MIIHQRKRANFIRLIVSYDISIDQNNKINNRVFLLFDRYLHVSLIGQLTN